MRDIRQTAMPGTGADFPGLAQRKADAPLKPAKPQEACDLGLFSDSNRQLDLVQLANQARKP